jgi:hypothetical protein
MICFYCHRPIRGAELADRYEWRRGGVVGDTTIYGKGELPLKQARGQLTRLSHGKCYHAWKKQGELADARDADPSSQPRPETDWRHQEVCDVEDLKPGYEGDRDHRGAGAPGQ